MRLRRRLVMLFSVLVVIAVGVTSLLTLLFVHSETIAHEIQEMHSNILDVEKDIQFLHEKASDDMLFALRNPLFLEYFSLPETKAGNNYKNGVIQFTQKQREIRSKLEQWIFHFQTKFIVDETCLIDKTGQEHVRLFRNTIEPDEELSPHESLEPFFEPTFEIPKGEVRIQPPYLSSDTHRWVFAYSSPIELENGERPAFFHFEMPVNIFHDLLPKDRGRMFVMDPKGHLMADTKLHYPTANIPAEFDEYFPPAKTVFNSESFDGLIRRMTFENEGSGTYFNEDEKHHVVFKRLKTFDWVLAYEIPQSTIMSTGNFSVRDLEMAVLVAAGVVILITIVTVFLVANRIVRPIVTLRDTAKKISEGDLTCDIAPNGDDELSDLARAFGSMTKSLRKTIQLEKKLAITEQELKEKKLTTMGSASARFAHDIRNLLSTIKTATELIKKKTNIMDAKTAEQHERLYRAVDKMTFQVNSVMNFVRTGPLQLQDHSIDDIVATSLRDLEIPEGISINRPRSGIKVECNGRAIGIVITNLITNAVEAVGSEGEITIRSELNDGKYVIEVEDSGPGIPDEILPRIFESLFTTKEEGTGLGLVSCMDIMEQHGGTIMAYNNPTRFVIVWPAASEQIGQSRGH